LETAESLGAKLPGQIGGLCWRSAESLEKLRQRHVEDLGDPAGGVHSDIDPSAFEKADMGAVQVALVRADLPDPRAKALLKVCVS
jgi:hypothetical protein